MIRINVFVFDEKWHKRLRKRELDRLWYNADRAKNPEGHREYWRTGQSSDTRREWDKQRRRNQRSDNVALGLCKICGKRSPVEGRSRCKNCILYFAIWRLKRAGLNEV